MIPFFCPEGFFFFLKAKNVTIPSPLFTLQHITGSHLEVRERKNNVQHENLVMKSFGLEVFCDILDSFCSLSSNLYITVHYIIH